jgi:hypothetical protein
MRNSRSLSCERLLVFAHAPLEAEHVLERVASKIKGGADLDTAHLDPSFVVPHWQYLFSLAATPNAIHADYIRSLPRTQGETSHMENCEDLRLWSQVTPQHGTTYPQEAKSFAI